MLQVQTLESKNSTRVTFTGADDELGRDHVAQWGVNAAELFFEGDGVGGTGEFEEFEDVAVCGEVQVGEWDAGAEIAEYGWAEDLLKPIFDAQEAAVFVGEKHQAACASVCWGVSAGTHCHSKPVQTAVNIKGTGLALEPKGTY